METTVIRELRPEDAPEIARITAAITRVHDKTDFKHVIEKVQGEEGVSFVALRGERIVGYCISYVLSGSFGMEKSAWLAMLGVDPAFMGQGIGEKLATETMKHFKERGIKDVYTSVRWDSTDLLSFFKTLGFERSDFINLHKSLK